MFNHSIKRIFFCILVFFTATKHAAAGTPNLSIVPVILNSNIVQLAPNQTASVAYTITNHLTNTQMLALQPSMGITHVTGSNNACSSPFLLAAGASCSLNLQINAAQLPTGTSTWGPTICLGSDNTQCAVPTPGDTLTVTIGSLALSTSTLLLAQQGILTTTSQPRTLTIINYAPFSATSVNYTIAPALPTGTTISPATCGTIQAGGACVLTVTPGSTPSTLPSTATTPPTPSVLTIQGSNTNTLTANLIVLAYNNFYQQGFVFALDDSASTSGSVGVKVAASQDNTIPTGNGAMVWDNGSSSITMGNADGSTTPCLGSYDGTCNTSSTVTGLTGGPEYLPSGSYAASLCANYQIDSNGNSPCSSGTTCYTEWYLPAICELGPDSGNHICAAQTDNMVTNLSLLLSGCSGPACFLMSRYWSSTEDSTYPAGAAWHEHISTGTGSIQFISGKGTANYIRCARRVTP